MGLSLCLVASHGRSLRPGKERKNSEGVRMRVISGGKGLDVLMSEPPHVRPVGDVLDIDIPEISKSDKNQGPRYNIKRADKISSEAESILAEESLFTEKTESQCLLDLVHDRKALLKFNLTELYSSCHGDTLPWCRGYCSQVEFFSNSSESDEEINEEFVHNVTRDIIGRIHFFLDHVLEDLDKQVCLK